MEENNSKKVLLSVLGVAILVVAVVGVSFAAFSFANTSDKANQIQVGTITMSFSESESVINITNAQPTADATAMASTTAGEYFEFTVTRKTNDVVKVPYTITVTPGTVTTGETVKQLATKYVRVGLTKVSGSTETTVVAAKSLADIVKPDNILSGTADKYVLYTVTDEAGAVYTGAAETYRLRMWLADTTKFAMTADDNTNTLDSTKTYSYRLKVNVDSTVSALGK